MIKNIVIITSYFAPAWSYGGPPRVLYSLANELVKQGKSIKVITTDARDFTRNTKTFEIIDCIEVFRFATISNFFSYRLKFFLVPNLLKKCQDILSWADVVLFSDLRSILNWQLYDYVYLHNIPYGLFAFGQIPQGIGFKAIVKNIFDYIWVKDFVKKASFRFCQTEHEQEMFLHWFNIHLSETQLLLLPVENQSVKTDPKMREEFQKRWGIFGDDRLILFVGRLHYLKGVDILINSVIPLLKKFDKLKLMIVGRDDGEFGFLRRLVDPEIRDKVIFTGALYGEDVRYAYLNSTCFAITPRHFEETSLASLEALSLGVPVVTTRQADIPFLEEYQAGYVVENNIKSVQTAILRILKRISNKEDMGKRANKLIKDHYHAEKITKKMLSYVSPI